MGKILKEGKVYVVTYVGDGAFPKNGIAKVSAHWRWARNYLMDTMQEELLFKYKDTPEKGKIEEVESFDKIKHFEYASGKEIIEYFECTEYSIGKSVVKDFVNAISISNEDGNICYYIDEIPVK